MKTVILIFQYLIFINVVPAQAVINPDMQQKVFKSIRDEMIRLDGEGLIARKGRTQDFMQTTDQILLNIKNNKTVFDFYNSFKQLDATYTNLHSRVVFPEEVENQVNNPWYKTQSVFLFSEVGIANSKFKIDFITDKKLENLIQIGDEVTAVNGRPISEWLDENFLFCKLPLRIQCDRHFEDNLLNLNLSWKGDTKLVYTVKKQDNTFIDIDVNFYDSSNGSPNNLRKRCDWRWEKRYPGFKLIHLGFFACLFEKEDDSTVALLRISSFMYSKKQVPENPFKNLEEEVSALEKNWIPKSNQYQNLIIDLLDNHGGNAPIPYYQILMKGEFQEQYVQFKKTLEIENSVLRKSIFWNDNAHELLFQKYLKSGLWNSLAYGEFTPPSPMFCSDESVPCDESYFHAKDHQFSGKVSVMVNEECISSCDGFAWAMKSKLNARFYGFPQAADSAYSRLRIDAILDDTSTNGFRIQINEQNTTLSPDLVVAQIVAISRATDENGNIFNGNPVDLEKLVSYTFEEYYPAKVLNEVLLDLR